jgi:hypothetical protein
MDEISPLLESLFLFMSLGHSQLSAQIDGRLVHMASPTGNPSLSPAFSYTLSLGFHWRLLFYYTAASGCRHQRRPIEHFWCGYQATPWSLQLFF